MPLALGSSPRAVGAALAPLVRDSAARLLLGCFRAHDLVHLQRLSAKETATHMLSSLGGFDAPPVGAYEALLARDRPGWQSTLGMHAVAAAEREASLAASYLAYSTLLAAQVAQSVAVSVLEALAAAAFPSHQLGAHLGRYLYSLEPTLTGELARNVTAVLAPRDEPALLAAALAPLVARVQEDLVVAAAHVKLAMGD